MVFGIAYFSENVHSATRAGFGLGGDGYKVSYKS